MKQSTGILQIKLTDDFTLKEFYVSAKHPAAARQIEILPEHIASLTRLCCTVLQPIRDFVGHAVTIGSGVRDTNLNLLVGGSRTSQHVPGEAADPEIKGNEAWKVFDWLFETKAGDIGQCIIYLTANKIPHFIHVSVPSLTNQVKPTGDFKVKLVGDDKYYKWGIDVIPGVESPARETEPEPEPIALEESEPDDETSDNE